MNSNPARPEKSFPPAPAQIYDSSLEKRHWKAYLNPLVIAKEWWRERALIATLARDEISRRYLNSALGWFWILLVPLVTLTVYVFVFGRVLPMKWNVPGESDRSFALALLCGLVPYSIVSETASGSVLVLPNNRFYLEKIRFPVGVLPLIRFLEAGVTATVYIALLLVVGIAMGTLAPQNAGFLFVSIASTVALAVGSAFWTASLGVFVRDIACVLPAILTLLLFASPVFYNPDSLSMSPDTRLILDINPMTSTIQGFRSFFLGGDLSVARSVASAAVSLAFLLSGAIFFYANRFRFVESL